MYQLKYEIDDILKWMKDHMEPKETWTDDESYLRAMITDMEELLAQIEDVNKILAISGTLAQFMHTGKVRLVCIDHQCELCKMQFSTFAGLVKRATHDNTNDALQTARDMLKEAKTKKRQIRLRMNKKKCEQKIAELLGDGPMTVAEVANSIGITVSWARKKLYQGVESGKFEILSRKFPSQFRNSQK
jgi:hypothetical protein